MAVYFIQKGEGGPIKIGTSIHPRKRIADIARAAMSDIRTLKIIDGDAALEKGLHRKFARLNISGEWFKPGESLLSYIEEAGEIVEGAREKNPLPSLSPPGPLEWLVLDVATYQFAGEARPESYCSGNHKGACKTSVGVRVDSHLLWGDELEPHWSPIGRSVCMLCPSIFASTPASIIVRGCRDMRADGMICRDCERRLERGGLDRDQRHAPIQSGFEHHWRSWAWSGRRELVELSDDTWPNECPDYVSKDGPQTSVTMIGPVDVETEVRGVGLRDILYPGDRANYTWKTGDRKWSRVESEDVVIQRADGWRGVVSIPGGAGEVIERDGVRYRFWTNDEEHEDLICFMEEGGFG